MMRQLPAYSLEERVAALSWSLDLIASYGVTTIKDAIVTTSIAETYREMSRQGRLPMRIKTSLTWKNEFARSHDEETALIAAREEYAAADVDTGFAKIMLDGVPIPPVFTAAMLEPYEPSELYPDGWRGKLIFEPEELNADVIELDRKGLSVKIHATGDWALRAALDAFEAAREANGDSGVIHEVSHAELIHPDDIPRFAALNVAAEMCPILWHPVPGLTWERWLGPDRKPWPIKRLVEAGALVTYGSDWSVVPTPNPWPGIEAMVTRADPTEAMAGTLWREQAVDLATAIRIFTVNSAKANRVGDTSGSLAPGKDADFIVVDRNIFDVPITDVGDTEVLMSVVGGKTVIDKL
ncbi:MAG: amidohydrolase family protein, partial [Gammaproteobacteria bacterium]|nr:amidohydrolase family protein [Gammaproteobacteria bacterium]